MPAEIVGGRYTLVAELGAGGMGQVYEGFDQHLKRRIAIKFTQPGLDSESDWAARFLQEAEVMARLRHPGMPAIYDAGAGNERPYLVMEFIEGRTFADLLSQHGPLPVEVVAALGAQIAAVLSATHRHRIYHRDLKPANLMLCADGTVKVLDFGLAVAGDMSRYTQTGHTLGTPAFMAPEQVEAKPVGAQTDLYALGLVLHELLTGKQVMTGATSYVVWQNQLHQPVPDIGEVCAGVPAAMSALIMRMVEKAVGRRPADASVVFAGLLPFAGGVGALVDDGDGPVGMYARAVGGGFGAGDSGVGAGADLDVVGCGATGVGADGAAERASGAGSDEWGDTAGDLRARIAETLVNPNGAALETLVDEAISSLGSRDADTVEARTALATLRFDGGEYASAAPLLRTLIADVTPERGPYDDQVMSYQRQLATCDAETGDVVGARDRLRKLYRQMAVRFGEQDRRVIELASQIRGMR
ncbi:serine/threonine-protein kinase [Nocardia camponoti]|uniref:Protein kinase domain-containing protein n=1 Tax=Nocardia camponoti TaxID=1616106 RepID=A0A917QT31_9NOCA|nr:serine/threonine-protein kinase [Nocardia camponoti]GGK66890.1 hypothetical protein GCM10011591_43800 [Nocardia camponoti]